MDNKNFPILIVEDDYISKESLKGYLQNLGYFKILEAKNSQEALQHCKDNNILLTFLDIGLTDSELDGIELGKKLNGTSDSAIVFTSSFTDNTTLHRSDEVNHQNYLAKPLREKDVSVAIRKALKEKVSSKVLIKTNQGKCAFMNQSDEVYVKRNDKFYQKVYVEDILYIKANNGGVSVYTLASGQLFTYTTLTSFMNQYDHPDIIKIHNGHAVNKKHIAAKSDSLIRLVDGSELPIGLKWRLSINSHFNMIKPKS